MNVKVDFLRTPDERFFNLKEYPFKSNYIEISGLRMHFLTAFSDSDPITRGGDIFMQEAIPGTKNQPHTTIKNAGHFLQEDTLEQLTEVVVNFLKQFR